MQKWVHLNFLFASGTGHTNIKTQNCVIWRAEYPQLKIAKARFILPELQCRPITLESIQECLQNRSLQNIFITLWANTQPGPIPDAVTQYLV